MEKLVLYLVGYLGAFLTFIAALADNILSVIALLSLGLGLSCASILILVALKRVECAKETEESEMKARLQCYSNTTPNCGK